MFNIVLIFYTIRAVERICRKFKGFCLGLCSIFSNYNKFVSVLYLAIQLASFIEKIEYNQ